MDKQVRKERTGWRDKNLSERHRMWGWDSPAVDLDFLFLEYDNGKAVALVEYKHERAKPQLASHPTYQALVDLGTRAGVPVFACRYAADFSWWRIVPLNDTAKSMLQGRVGMSEVDWVAFLYKIRGRVLPQSVIDGLAVQI